ncbi:uncharacterized protein LOC127702839 [Mytilus californianus]|uniref:uncharacterized protein LOC127702839 n=1 Tax=Mytilus californianus TaxID=6549 RepID=UPI002246CA76|nr:uncharacterized protein LOC127702839 [Mytilus californianus]
MEDSRIFHLRRIGPSKTLPIAVDHMDFTNSVSIIGRGRTAGVDFIIDSANRNRSLYISRIHARVVKQDNKHILYDDSRNGVFVNNSKIGDSIHLNEGDRVTFGHHIGENLAIGTRRRQPDSEYQFIFERCNCGLQNQGRQTAMGSRTMTIIDSINSNACMPRGCNTEVPMTTSVQRQAVNSSKNEIAEIIYNRPCHTEMSVEGMHVNDPISNDNISRNNDHADLPTIAVSSNLTEAMDDNANFQTNSVTNSSYDVTEAGSVRDEEEIGTSSLKNNNSLKTETSFINVQSLETVSLNENVSDMPCMGERIVTNEMPSGDENLIDNNKEDNTRELNISMESIQESYERQSVESVENLNEERDGEDDSLGEDGHSANSGKECQVHSANSGKECQGHSANSGEEHQSDYANSCKEHQGHSANSDDEDQGHSAYSGEEDQGHSDNSCEEDQGHSANNSGDEHQGHSANNSGEEDQSHSYNSGEEDQDHSAISGEEHQGENGIDQNIEEIVEENRQLTRNSRSTADNEDNEYNDLNVSEMFDESFSEEEDEVDLNILENDDNDGEDGDDQLEDANNRRDNSDSNQNNKVVHEEDNGESSIYYSSSIDYSLVDICGENDSSQKNDKVENADEVVRFDENSDQGSNKSVEENDNDVVFVGENSDDDVREVKSIDDVDGNNIRDTDSVESCSIEYNDLDGSGAVDSHSDNYDDPSFIDLDVSVLESEDEDHEESGDEEHEESGDENHEESGDEDHEESDEEGEEDEITVLKMKIRKEEVCPVKESPEGISFSEESADEIEEVGDHVICDEKNNKQFEDNENNIYGRNMENITYNKNSEIQEDEKNPNSSEDHKNHEGSIEDKFQVNNQESNAKNESPYSFANDEKQENIEDNGKRENFQDDHDHDESVEEEYDDSLECSVDDINEESVESYENEDNVVEDLLTVNEKPNRKDDGSLRSIEDDQEIVDNYEVKQNVLVFIETPNIKEQETKEALCEHTEIFIKEEGESKTNCTYDQNQESEEIVGTQEGVEDHEKQESEKMDGTRETFEDHKMQENDEIDGTQETLEDHEMQENEEMDRTQETLEDEKQESEESIGDHENQESDEIVDHENQEIDGTQERVKIDEKQESEEIDRTQESIEVHEKQEREEIKDYEKQESKEIDGTQESLEKHEKLESEEIDGKHESIEDHENKKRKQIDGTQESIEENGKQEIEEIEDHENKSEEIDGTQESVTKLEMEQWNRIGKSDMAVSCLQYQETKIHQRIDVGNPVTTYSSAGEILTLVLEEKPNLELKQNSEKGNVPKIMDTCIIVNQSAEIEMTEGQIKKMVATTEDSFEVENIVEQSSGKEMIKEITLTDDSLEEQSSMAQYSVKEIAEEQANKLVATTEDSLEVQNIGEQSLENEMTEKHSKELSTTTADSSEEQNKTEKEIAEGQSEELVATIDDSLEVQNIVEQSPGKEISEGQSNELVPTTDDSLEEQNIVEQTSENEMTEGQSEELSTTTDKLLEEQNIMKHSSEKEIAQGQSEELVASTDDSLEAQNIVEQSSEIEMTEGQSNEMVAITDKLLEEQNSMEQSSEKEIAEGQSEKLVASTEDSLKEQNIVEQSSEKEKAEGQSEKLVASTEESLEVQNIVEQSPGKEISEGQSNELVATTVDSLEEQNNKEQPSEKEIAKGQSEKLEASTEDSLEVLNNVEQSTGKEISGQSNELVASTKDSLEVQNIVEQSSENEMTGGQLEELSTTTDELLEEQNSMEQSSENKIAEGQSEESEASTEDSLEIQNIVEQSSGKEISEGQSNELVATTEDSLEEQSIMKQSSKKEIAGEQANELVATTDYILEVQNILEQSLEKEMTVGQSEVLSTTTADLLEEKNSIEQSSEKEIAEGQLEEMVASTEDSLEEQNIVEQSPGKEILEGQSNELVATTEDSLEEQNSMEQSPGKEISGQSNELVAPTEDSLEEQNSMEQSSEKEMVEGQVNEMEATTEYSLEVKNNEEQSSVKEMTEGQSKEMETTTDELLEEQNSMEKSSEKETVEGQANEMVASTEDSLEQNFVEQSYENEMTEGQSEELSTTTDKLLEEQNSMEYSSEKEIAEGQSEELVASTEDSLKEQNIVEQSSEREIAEGQSKELVASTEDSLEVQNIVEQSPGKEISEGQSNELEATTEDSLEEQSSMEQSSEKEIAEEQANELVATTEDSLEVQNILEQSSEKEMTGGQSDELSTTTANSLEERNSMKQSSEKEIAEGQLEEMVASTEDSLEEQNIVEQSYENEMTEGQSKELVAPTEDSLEVQNIVEQSPGKEIIEGQSNELVAITKDLLEVQNIVKQSSENEMTGGQSEELSTTDELLEEQNSMEQSSEKEIAEGQELVASTEDSLDIQNIVEQSSENEMTEGQSNEMRATTEDSLEEQNIGEQSPGKEISGQSNELVATTEDSLEVQNIVEQSLEEEMKEGQSKEMVVTTEDSLEEQNIMEQSPENEMKGGQSEDLVSTTEDSLEEKNIVEQSSENKIAEGQSEDFVASTEDSLKVQNIVEQSSEKEMVDGQSEELSTTDKLLEEQDIVKQSSEREIAEGQSEKLVASTEDSLEVQNIVEQSPGKEISEGQSNELVATTEDSLEEQSSMEQSSEIEIAEEQANELIATTEDSLEVQNILEQSSEKEMTGSQSDELSTTTANSLEERNSMKQSSEKEIAEGQLEEMVACSEDSLEEHNIVEQSPGKEISEGQSNELVATTKDLLEVQNIVKQSSENEMTGGQSNEMQATTEDSLEEQNIGEQSPGKEISGQSNELVATTEDSLEVQNIMEQSLGKEISGQSNELVATTEDSLEVQNIVEQSLEEEMKEGQSKEMVVTTEDSLEEQNIMEQSPENEMTGGKSEGLVATTEDSLEEQYIMEQSPENEMTGGKSEDLVSSTEDSLEEQNIVEQSSENEITEGQLEEMVASTEDSLEVQNIVEQSLEKEMTEGQSKEMKATTEDSLEEQNIVSSEKEMTETKELGIASEDSLEVGNLAELSTSTSEQTTDRKTTVGQFIVKGRPDIETIPENLTEIEQLIENSVNPKPVIENIHLPEKNVSNIKQTTDDVDDLQATDDVNNLQATFDINDLQATDDVNDLQVTGDVNDLQATDDVNDLQATDDVNDLQATGGNDFQATGDVNDLQATCDVNDLQTTDGVIDLQATDDVNDLQATGDVNDLQTTDDVNDLQATGDVNDLQTTDDVNDLQATGDVNDLQATDDVNDLQATEIVDKMELPHEILAKNELKTELAYRTEEIVGLDPLLQMEVKAVSKAETVDKTISRTGIIDNKQLTEDTGTSKSTVEKYANAKATIENEITKESLTKMGSGNVALIVPPIETEVVNEPTAEVKDCVNLETETPKIRNLINQTEAGTKPMTQFIAVREPISTEVGIEQRREIVVNIEPATQCLGSKTDFDSDEESNNEIVGSRSVSEQNTTNQDATSVDQDLELENSEDPQINGMENSHKSKEDTQNRNKIKSQRYFIKESARNQAGTSVEINFFNNSQEWSDKVATVADKFPAESTRQTDKSTSNVISRKRKLPSEFESTCPVNNKKLINDINDTVTGYFKIRDYIKKRSIEPVTLKKNLIKGYVQNFFHRNNNIASNLEQKDILIDNMGNFDAARLLKKQQIKYFVHETKNDEIKDHVNATGKAMSEHLEADATDSTYIDLRNGLNIKDLTDENVNSIEFEHSEVAVYESDEDSDSHPGYEIVIFGQQNLDECKVHPTENDNVSSKIDPNIDSEVTTVIDLVQEETNSCTKMEESQDDDDQECNIKNKADLSNRPNKQIEPVLQTSESEKDSYNGTAREEKVKEHICQNLADELPRKDCFSQMINDEVGGDKSIITDNDHCVKIADIKIIDVKGLEDLDSVKHEEQMKALTDDEQDQILTQAEPNNIVDIDDSGTSDEDLIQTQTGLEESEEADIQVTDVEQDLVATQTESKNLEKKYTEEILEEGVNVEPNMAATQSKMNEIKELGETKDIMATDDPDLIATQPYTDESDVKELEESVTIVKHDEFDESVVISNVSHGNLFEDTLVNVDEINSDDTTGESDFKQPIIETSSTCTENTDKSECRTQLDTSVDLFSEIQNTIDRDGNLNKDELTKDCQPVMDETNNEETTVLDVHSSEDSVSILDNYQEDIGEDVGYKSTQIKEKTLSCEDENSKDQSDLAENDSFVNEQIDENSKENSNSNDGSLTEHDKDTVEKNDLSTVLNEQIDDSSKENSKDGSLTEHGKDTVENNQESGLFGNKDDNKIDDIRQESLKVAVDSFVFDFSNNSDFEDSEKLMIDLQTGKDDTSQYDSDEQVDLQAGNDDTSQAGKDATNQAGKEDTSQAGKEDTSQYNSDEEVAEDVDVSNESLIIVSDSTENGKSDFEEIVRDITNKYELDVDNKSSVSLNQDDTYTGDHLEGKVRKIFTSFMKSESSTEEIERVRNTSGNYGDDKTNHSTYALPDFEISSDGSLLKSESRSRESSVEFVCTVPVTPSADLYNDDSDSLPEVEFLRASPAKHPIVKEEKSGDDSGLESGIDVVDKVDDFIDQNCKTLIVRLPCTPTKKNEQIKAVFHVSSDSSSLENNTPIQRCVTPVKSRESTPSKLKLKLKKLDAGEESPRKKQLRKKKNDPSPKKQKSPVKIPEEPDDNHKKRPSRKKRTDTSSEKVTTPVIDGEVPVKREGRKRKLDQSSKTPEKRRETPSKKKKQNKEKRRLSDLIEVFTDDDSESEMVSTSSRVITERNEGLAQDNGEPSYEVATAESSSLTDNTSQKDSTDRLELCSQETNTTEKDAVQGTQSSISDIDNIHSEDSTDGNTPPCQQMILPDEEISEISFSNTVVTDSVTEDESICLERLPGLVPSDQTTATSNDENEADFDDDHTCGETSPAKEIDRHDIQCTFEDIATDDDDNEDIGNIVNFLENETVCYSDLHEDQRSLSGQSDTGDDFPTVDREFLSPTFEMVREPESGEKNGFLPESEENNIDSDNLHNNGECEYFPNGMETSTPNELETVSLRRLQNLERKLQEKSLNRQLMTRMQTDTPDISRNDETVLYHGEDSNDNDQTKVTSESSGIQHEKQYEQDDDQAVNIEEGLMKSYETNRFHEKTAEEHVPTPLLNDDLNRNTQCPQTDDNRLIDHDNVVMSQPMYSGEASHNDCDWAQLMVEKDGENGPAVYIENVGANFSGDFDPFSGEEDNDVDNGTPLSLQFSNSSLTMPANYDEEVGDDEPERMEQATNYSAANKENFLKDTGHHRMSQDISIKRDHFGSWKGSSIDYQEDEGNFDQGQNKGYNEQNFDILYERNSNSLSSYPQNIKEEIKSPEEIMPKRKAKDLLEKLRAKKIRLSLPKPTVPLEVNQNDGQVAGPSQGRPPTPAMSGDLERCRDVVLKLRKSLTKEKKMKNQQRVEAWKQELKELESKLCSPKVTVAVVGTTGAGKSSLMNAIIDHYNVLPTSGTQACTAVVVKIESNNTSDLFEADIEFLSREEWENELQLLKKDLTDKNGKIKKVKPDPETEAGVAFLKMRAVYGKFETFEQLSRPTPVTRCLGKTETIKSSSSSTFRNKIDKYIENTSSKTGGQYWPIIKSVTIRIPHCSVCSNGCTLVDLPGVRDSNAARDRIAKDYLKNCSVILVVAEVHRASTSKTAKELLGDNFRRQLLMDGQYGNVAFVCTKNDVLQPSELIRELELDDKTDCIDKNLTLMMIKMDELKQTERTLKEEIQCLLVDISTLTNAVDELQKDITEITELVSLVDTQEENEQLEELRSDLQRKSVKLSLKQQAVEAKGIKVENIKSQKNQLEIEMNHKRKTINMICAKARTNFARNAIKKDYKAGVREMKRKAKMTQEEIDEDEEDDYVSDEDDNDKDLTRSCDNLQVFCVSSSEYQKLNNRLTDDGPPMVFDDEEDTEIPAVRQFIRQITNQKREEATKRLVQNLAVFIYDIQNYLTENGLTNKNDRFTVQSAVADFSSRLQEELSPVLDSLQQDVGHELDSSIAAQLNRGVEVAVNSAVDTCKGWSSSVKKDEKHKGGLCFSTYNATVRRYGNFKSPTSGLIDFNEDLAEPLTTSISIVWTKFFSVDLWDLLERHKLRILNTLRSFTGRLCDELLSLNVSRNQLDTAQRQFHLISETKLTEMIRNLKEFVIERQRDMNRMFPPTIQEHLKATYENCKNDSGKGLFQRMKNKMEGGVDNERPNMFQSASSTLLTQLEQLMNDVIDKVKEVCSTLCSNLQAVFEPLWNSCEASKQLKSTLFKDITEAALEMSSLCQTAGVQLPIRSAMSTREAIHLPRTTTHGTSGLSDVATMVSSTSQHSLYANRVVELPGCSATSIASNIYDPGQQDPLMPQASQAMNKGIPGKLVRHNTAVEIPHCGRGTINRIQSTSTVTRATNVNKQTCSSAGYQFGLPENSPLHIQPSPANILQIKQVEDNWEEKLTHGKESYNFMMNTSNSKPSQVAVQQPKTSVAQNNRTIAENQCQQSGNTAPKYVSILTGHVTYKKQTGNKDLANNSTQRGQGKPGNNKVNEGNFRPLIPTPGRRSVDGGHGASSLVPQSSESTMPAVFPTFGRSRSVGGNHTAGHSTSSISKPVSTISQTHETRHSNQGTSTTSIPVSTISQTHGTRHPNSLLVLQSPVSGRQNACTHLVSQPSPIGQSVVQTSRMNSPILTIHSFSQPSDFVLEQKTNNSYVMKTPSCISSHHPLIPGNYVPVTTDVPLPSVRANPTLRTVAPTQMTSVHKTNTQPLDIGQHIARSTTHKFTKYPNHSTVRNTLEIPVTLNDQRPLTSFVQTTRTCQTKNMTQSSAVPKSCSSQNVSHVRSCINRLPSTTNVTNSKTSRNLNPVTSTVASSPISRLPEANYDSLSRNTKSLHEKAMIEDIRGKVWRLGKRKQSDYSQGSKPSLNPNISTSVVFTTPVQIKTEAMEEPGPPKRRRPQKGKPVVITISDSDSD